MIAVNDDVLRVEGIDFAYGIGGLFLRRGLLHPHLTFTRAIVETGSRLIGMTGPLSIDGRFFAKWFPLSITALGAFSIETGRLRTAGHRLERNKGNASRQTLMCPSSKLRTTG